MAANVTVDGFLKLYPIFGQELDSQGLPNSFYFDRETIQIYLDIASDYVGLNRKCLGTDIAREIAIYALTAHFLWMLRNSNLGLAGPVTNAAEGSVSAGFAVPAISNRSWFIESPYGRMFLQLMLPCIMGGVQFTPRHYHPWG